MAHKTNTIRIRRKFVQVDKEISELIYQLNKCGLRTLTSCQKDEDGNSYIVFDYEKIRLASVVNTPHPILLLKWRKNNKKRIHSDTQLSCMSDATQKTKDWKC